MNYIDALAAITRNALRRVLGEAEGYMRPANQTRPTGTVATDFGTVLLKEIGERCTPVQRRGEVPDDPEATEMNLLLDSYDQFIVSVQFFRARAQVTEGDRGTPIDAAGIPEQSQWALSQAQHLVKSLRSPFARMVLQPLGLGFVRARTKPKDLTVLNDSTWESRAQVDLEFGIVNRQVMTVQILAGVSGQLKFNNAGDNVIPTTIEVSS